MKNLIISMLTSLRLDTFTCIYESSFKQFHNIVVCIDDIDKEFNSYRFKGNERIEKFLSMIEGVGAELSEAEDYPFFDDLSLFAQLVDRHVEGDFLNVLTCNEFERFYCSETFTDYTCYNIDTDKNKVTSDYYTVNIVTLSRLFEYLPLLEECIEFYLSEKAEAFDEKKYLNEWYNAQQI